MKTVFSLLFFMVLTAHAQYVEDEWEERDSWMHVDKLFETAGVAEGLTIADIGCHEGYLSIHLAKQVQRNGKIYAVDVKRYRLDALKDNASRRNIHNIETILGDYDDPKLPLGIFDIVFVVDTYHEMEAHEEILSHIKKALKPSGKLVILEKLKQHMRGKSRNQQVQAHTLSMKYVKKELKDAGFALTHQIQDFGDWENNPDKQMWVLVATPEKD